MILLENEENLQEGAMVLLNKPLNWTSFDLTNKVKFVLKHQFRYKKIKVGHAGTLDPLATGLMVVCIGKYTKKIESFQGLEKEYIASLRLGATTPSFDLETEIDQEFSVNHITGELIDEALEKFRGKINQRPPDFSAIKINGQRAYELAREGKKIQIKTKQVIINKLEVLSFKNNILKILVVCSKGTYIRALARDIGKALHSGAHLIALERTRIGKFQLKEALEVVDFVKKIKKL